MIYFCATPIGNLEDISLRAIRTLKEADIIAAEDTRNALKLLNHLGISKKLISYHHHNRHRIGQKIIDYAKNGMKIAVVSDAGMPAVSDPGTDLVSLARENKVPITIIPGPSALLSALLLSGMDGSRFVFEGFLPRDKKTRRKRISLLKNEDRTVIMFESPHKLINTLEELFEELGKREIAIAREMTKLFEEVVVCGIDEALMHFREHSPKGEVTLVLRGALTDEAQPDFDITIDEHISNYIKSGLSKKEAVKKVALDRKLPKGHIYKHSINIDTIDESQ